MALTTQEEAQVRALLAGVGDTALTPELLAKINQANNDNIRSGSISGASLNLSTREGEQVGVQGSLPVIPADLINQEALNRAIANVRQVASGGNTGDFYVRGAGDTAVWRALGDTDAGSFGLGQNILNATIAANTVGLTPVRVPFDLASRVMYAFAFQSTGTTTVSGLEFGIGDNRPKAFNGGTCVLTTNGISITDGFNGALTGIHRITGRVERGKVSDNVLGNALATNGSSRTIPVPDGFEAYDGIYVGTQTPANGYRDHLILVPFIRRDQNVYTRDGIGFSLPLPELTIRADSGADANDQITSVRFVLL